MDAPGRGDTEIGGMRRRFPTTRWSILTEATGADAESDRRRALEALAQAYWKPVYCYLRAKWSCTREDAKDLTQDFFAGMLEGRFLPAEGRCVASFRSFLRVALDRYLIDEHRRRQALKRGGAQAIFRLDAEWNEASLPEVEDPAGRPPEQILDDAWRARLLERAARQYEEECRVRGVELHSRIFHDYVLQGDGELPYRALAERYGIRVADVENYLKQAKRRYREILRKEISETVAGEEELREEIRHLFGEGPP